MRDLKTNFNDRLTNAQEAKKALVAKLKPKPTVTDPNFVHRDERRAAELEAVRKAREDAKEAARLAAEAAKEEARLALLNDEAAQLDIKRNERKDRKAQAKAEARAKREAKSAGRR